MQHLSGRGAPRLLEHCAVLERVTSGERPSGEKKPDDVIDKIVAGKIKAFFEDSVLLEQPFVKDDAKTIQLLLDEVGAKVGEKVAVRRFVRYKLGESTEA